MPLIRINAGDAGPELHGHKRPLSPVLIRGLRTPGPVIIMIHGFKYAPGHPSSCPHDHILGMTARRDSRRTLSWPRGLGFGSGVSREGLGIAFGWPARGSIWQAYGRAKTAGLSLVELITMIRRTAPDRDIHVLAHSFGARVVLSALPHLPARALRRIILLSGAEFGSRAAFALDSDAGRTAEVINVTSRENDIFDFILERLIRAPIAGDQTLSHGIADRPNLLTLQMDQPETLLALKRCGFKISNPANRICHWSSYMRPGVFNLYRALLRRSDEVDLPHLRAVLPKLIEPRWTRLFALPKVRFGLPSRRKPSA